MLNLHPAAEPVFPIVPDLSENIGQKDSTYIYGSIGKVGVLYTAFNLILPV